MRKNIFILGFLNRKYNNLLYEYLFQSYLSDLIQINLLFLIQMLDLSIRLIYLCRKKNHF